MHIAGVAYTNYFSDNRVRRESEALASRGNEVDIFCLAQPSAKRVEKVNGVKITRLPIIRYRGKNKLRYLFSYLLFTVVVGFHLGTKHLQKNYDLIHVHNMPDFVVFSAIIPRILGAKVLLEIHDPSPETFATRFSNKAGNLFYKLVVWIEKISASFAHHVITVNIPCKELLVGRGLNTNKVSIVVNTPDDQIFTENLAGDTTNEFLIVHHGVIANRQGIDIAVKAVAKLTNKFPELKFKIIGSGDSSDNLKRLINTLGLEGVVEFSGQEVPVDQLPGLLKNASLALVPFRLSNSTKLILPVKLMEYVLLGIPVIVSRSSTIEKYFDSSMVKFVTPGSVDELADAIEELYVSPDIRLSLAKNAQRFSKEYNWRTEKQKLFEIIDALFDVDKTHRVGSGSDKV